MPFVAKPRQPTTDPVCELLAKFARPLPHRFVADDDAAGGQQLLDHTQPEREPKIQPDGVADDLGGEPVPGIGREQLSSSHPTTHLDALPQVPRCQVDGADRTEGLHGGRRPKSPEGGNRGGVRTEADVDLWGICRCCLI